MKCPNCNSENIEEEWTVDFVEWDEKEDVEYVHWCHKCNNCGHVWSEQEGE